MTTKKTDPDGVGIDNGNYFGFDFNIENSNIVIIPIPWDVTTSYQKGTSKGPESIIKASVQLDFFDLNVDKAWEIGHYTHKTPADIADSNKVLRSHAEKIIDHLEKGRSIKDTSIAENLNIVNSECRNINRYVYETATHYLNNDKLCIINGGDHSVPLGFIEALADKNNSFGILHIDAHADLREAYEGFEYSHASIMHNAIKLDSVKQITQVGIRDLCSSEAETIKNSSEITCFYDDTISEMMFNGRNWNAICDIIVDTLPEKVYLSFDIDGLDPSLCPNTGTPVPGGLSFNQAIYLIKKVVEKGKKIIGCDLCEVAPGNNEWDANVGARILYSISNLMYKSNIEVV